MKQFIYLCDKEFQAKSLRLSYVVSFSVIRSEKVDLRFDQLTYVFAVYGFSDYGQCISALSSLIAGRFCRHCLLLMAN